MLKKYLAAVVVLSCISFPALAQEQAPIQDEHAALREVLHTVQDAINTQDYDKMLPVISDQSIITPVNQEVLHGKKEVSEYFKRWFGPGRKLAKLEIEITAEKKTEMIADGNFGLVYGDAVEKYTLQDGRKYDMNVKWTATMAKEDGAWKIRSYHSGVDFLNNPILSEVKGTIPKVGIGAFLAGLIIGFGLFRLFRPKNVG